MPGCRSLRFDRLDDVAVEVDRLLASHRVVGRWDLAQICTHLAASLRLTTEAGEATERDEPAPTVDRARRIARDRLFRSGRFPEGVELPTKALDPGPPGADPGSAAEALREAIARFRAAEGPMATHPMLGPLDQDQWDQFHRIHCAHHLGFVLPLPADPRVRNGDYSGRAGHGD